MKNNKSLLTQFLLCKEAYAHPVKEIKLIETHISHVILTGYYAYKIKKDINIGFINFEKLSDRLTYCKEEIRLNRRLYPELYIGLCLVYLDKGRIKMSPEIKANEYNRDLKIIEYAIKMKQFEQSSLVSLTLKSGKDLPKDSISKLAKELADFHISVNNPDNCIHEVDISSTILEPVKINLRIIDKLIESKKYEGLIAKHREWSNYKYKQLYKRFMMRKTNKVFRECHGDIHTENIHIKDKSDLKIFDAIDFDPKLRWIDPISEIAFLYMDLNRSGLHKEAIELLNIWLEETGDYQGADLLQWYLCYRALVRAKVLLIRGSQYRTSSSDLNRLNTSEGLSKDIESYLQESFKYQEKEPLALILMHGLSGSGKSFLSQKLCYELSAIRIRSDIERRRICGKMHLQKIYGFRKARIEGGDNTPINEKECYSKSTSKFLFNELIPKYAGRCLQGGMTTIIDATFLKEEERKASISLANQIGIPLVIVTCECNDEIASKRINQRFKNANDPSEANLQIRNKQKEWIEPLTSCEQLYEVKYSQETSLKDVIQSINRLIKIQSV